MCHRMDRAARIVAGEGKDMTDDEIAKLMNDTAGQHWGTEHHFRRFAYILLAAERQRCVQIAREFDRDHPNTNYGGYIARLIEEPAL
jgi:hypothetical protein